MCKHIGTLLFFVSALILIQSVVPQSISYAQELTEEQKQQYLEKIKTLPPEQQNKILFLLLISQVSELFNQKNYIEAEQKAEQAHSLAQQFFSKEDKNYLLSLNYLAQAYSYNNRFNEEKSTLEEAYKLSKKIYGEDIDKYSTISGLLAGIYFKVGQYAESKKLYEEYLEFSKSTLTKNDIRLAQIYQLLGRNNFYLGFYDEAENNLKEALNIYSRINNKQENFKAVILNDLGVLNQSRGSYADAEKYYLMSVDIKLKLYSENHIPLAGSYTNLGDLYRIQGNYSKSTGFLNKAKTIYENINDQSSVSYSEYLNTLSLLFYDTNQFDQAKDAILKAIIIRKNILGEVHPLVEKPYVNLGSIYLEQGYLDKAKENYNLALSINQKIHKTENISLAIIYGGLGNLYLKYYDFEKSLNYYKDGLNIAEKFLGKESPSLAIYYNNLGFAYSNQGKYKLAEKQYKKSLELNKKYYGEHHKSVATSYNNLGVNSYDQGEFKNAELFYKKSIDIYQKASAHEIESIEVRNNLGHLYSELYRLDDAEEILLNNLKIIENNYGKNNTLYFSTNNNLGTLYLKKGNFNKSESIFNQNIKILRDNKDTENPDLAITFNNLAVLKKELSLYDEVEILYKKAINIYKKIYSDFHPKLLTAELNLAAFYTSTGRLNEAESILANIIDINEKHPQRVIIFTTLANLAEIKSKKGQFQEAKGLYNKSIKIALNLYGENNAKVSRLLNNIGLMLKESGLYLESEIHLKKALEINQRIFKENNNALAVNYNNLADLLTLRGDYFSALDYYLKAIDITKENFEHLNVNLALYYGNLGSLYVYIYKYSEALILFNQVLLIKSAIFGNDNYSAMTFNNIGSVYVRQGLYEKAIINFQKAIEIREKYFGTQDLDLIFYQHNLGDAYQSSGNYKEALTLYEKVLENKKNKFGENHPKLVSTYNSLAILYSELGQVEEAKIYIEKALRNIDIKYDSKSDLPLSLEIAQVLINRQYILNKFSPKNKKQIEEEFNSAKFTIAYLERYRSNITSDTSKIIQWGKFMAFFELALDSLYLYKQNIGPINGEDYIFLETALARTFLEILSSRNIKLERPIPEKVKNEEDQLYEKKKFIENKILPIQQNGTTEVYKKLLQQHESEFSRFIDYLYKTYPIYAYSKYPKPIALTEVMNNLISNDNIALSYFVGNNNTYLLILTKDKVELKKLSLNKKELESMIKNLRNSTFWYENKEDPCKVTIKSLKQIKYDLNQFNLISKKLYEKLLSPAYPYIKDKKEIIIIPHSVLWLLPFELLIDKDDQYFIHNHIVTYQNSYTTWFLTSILDKSKVSNNKVFLGVGDAIYENDSRYNDSLTIKNAETLYSKVKNVNDKYNYKHTIRLAQNSKDFDNGLKSCKWTPLESSKEEIETIMSLSNFKNSSDSRLGIQASEWNLDDLEKYKYIHFSVHGSMNLPRENNIIQPAMILTQINPKNSSDDGILTMQEVISNLKLDADLVVLSSCETGLGEVLEGEGVMSMTRAFQLAGASSVLASLWKVQEDATKLFFIQFYRYLNKGETPIKSLYLTKKDFIERKIIHKNSIIDLSHPFFWGAFVLVGGN